jgi:hypothetical protein
MFKFRALSYSFNGFKAFIKTSFASLAKILLFCLRNFYACKAKIVVKGSSYLYTSHFSSTNKRLMKKGDMI